MMGQVLQGQGSGQRLMPYRMTQILMCHLSRLLIVDPQVVLKKTVTVHQALRVRGQRLRVEYELAQESCLPLELNMHPNRQFPGLFVVNMPSCLHVLLLVMRPFFSPWGWSFWVSSPGGVGIPSRAGGY